MPDTLLFLATCPHCGGEFHTEYAPATLPPPRRHWRGRDTTAADLAGLTEAEQLRLMIERFSRSSAPDETAVIVEYAMEKLKEIERGRALVALADEGLAQLDRDVLAVESRIDEVIAAGAFVYGHQSRIAEILGGTNAGAFRSDRVLPVEAYLTENWIDSTTSTAENAPGRAVERGEAA